MNRNQKTVVIINPTAGRGRAGKQASEIRKLLGPVGADWEWRYTQGSGDAERLAREAVSGGAEMVVAVGGDGTLHEVANGVLGSSAVIGLIPFGTGNDLARCLGIYGDLGRACRALTEGKIQDLDMGVIEGNGTGGPIHFLVLCGTGFDAQTARTVNQGIRYLSGASAYVWGAILTLLKFTPFDLTMKLDGGEEHRTKAMFASIANVETTGGGMRIAPGAQCDDGLLDICLVREVPKSTLLYQLTQVFKGAHVNHPAVSMLQCSSVNIDADPPQPLLIDGEVRGTTPATIKLLPKALKIMVPAE